MESATEDWKVDLNEIACPECGKVNPGRAKFCGGCGKKLSAARKEAPASAFSGTGADAPLIADDFEALFSSGDPEATDESDLFSAVVGDSDRFRKDGSSSKSEVDIELGAEELEKLFDTGSPGEKDLEALFGRYAEEDPSTVASSIPPVPGEITGGGTGGAAGGKPGGGGFEDIIAREREQREGRRKLDDSSPSALLLDGDDVLSEARRELERPDSKDADAGTLTGATTGTGDRAPDGEAVSTGEPADTSGAGTAGDMEHGREDITGTGLDDVSEDDEGAHPGKTDREPVAGADDETDRQTPGSRRKTRKRGRERATRLPSSLLRNKLLHRPTFTGRLASVLAFAALSVLSALFGMSAFATVTPESAGREYLVLAAVPPVGLLAAYLLKRILRLERTPLPELNLLMSCWLFAVSFGLVPSKGSAAEPAPLDPASFKAHVMCLAVIAGVFHVLRSKLLHRTFRYVLSTIGVYSLTGLVGGIVSHSDYLSIIARRQIDLVSPHRPGSVVDLLATAFEPTFMAVNFFLPIVTMVLAFEGMRLLVNRFWRHALGLFLACAFFGLVIAGNIPLYESAGVPNLRSMARGAGLARKPVSRPATGTPAAPGGATTAAPGGGTGSH